MKKNYSFFLKIFLFAITSGLLHPSLKAQVVQTYSYTGTNQPFTIPVCVSTVTLEAWGAQGGANWVNNDNFGGYASAVFTVSAGQILNIYVGSQPTGTLGGYNGGGTGESLGQGGGGATDVRLGGITLMDRILVAGGGGGAGYWSNLHVVGGQGGGLSGGNGYRMPADPGGQGGTQVGSGNGTCVSLNNPSVAGVLGAGGSVVGCGCEGYGGGGGYYGGAGSGNCRGGGGGSGYILSGAANPTFSTGIRAGNGLARLSYFTNGSGVSVAPSATTVCNGSPANLIASGVVSYTWSNGAQTSSISVSPNASTNYTVQGTNALGCISSSVITVTVDGAIPNLNIINTTSMICAGKSATLTATGASTYTWSGPVPVTNGVGFTPAATGSYTIAGANSCGTSTAVASVTVNPLPNITASANNPTVCYGSQVVLTGTGSAIGYTWTGGVSNNSAFIPPVGTNTYVVTGSSANNCTNTAVVTVTVFQTPTITPVATPTAICVGKTATVSAVGSINGYTWTTVPPVYTSTMAVAPVVTTTYSVIRANSVCSATATVVVVVNPLPNLLVGAPNPSVICAGTCATLTGQGAITYTWYPGGFQGGVTTVCPNSSTEYTVVASNSNCTTSATSSLTILPNPVLSIQASTTTVCAGSPVSMTVSGASTYTWGSPVPAPQQNQSVITGNPLIATLYAVSGTSSLGCTGTSNQVILVNASTNVTASVVNPNGFICAGGIGTLTANGILPVNYAWSHGPTVSTTTVNPSSTTAYTVTGTNPNTGCQSVSSVTLSVYISTFVVSSPTAICKGNTATLSVAGAANNYSWSAGSPNNNDSIFVSPPNSTIYYVSGFTGSCSTTQTINLVVNPIPPVSAVAQKITICRFEPAVLSGSGATSYSWAGGTGATTPNYTVFPQITTTYTLTGTDANGCSKTIQVTQLVATCIGIEEHDNLAGLFNIYPNPNRGEFTIEAETAVNITIISGLGQVIKAFSLSQKENKIHITSLAEGVYFIKLEKDGNVAIKKVVVEK